MAGEWITPGTLALIKQRRAEGIGFAVIAAEIGNGCTKNAAIGAARRAGHPQPSRTDPHAPWTLAEVTVLRDNATLLMRGLVKLLPGRTPNAIQRKRGSEGLTGPALGPPRGRTTYRRLPVQRSVPLPPFQPRPVIVAPPPVPRPVVVTVAAQERLARGCQWISGDPKRRGWTFCDEPCERLDRPYCVEHAKLAKGNAAVRERAEAA